MEEHIIRKNNNKQTNKKTKKQQNTTTLIVKAYSETKLATQTSEWKNAPLFCYFLKWRHKEQR